MFSYIQIQAARSNGISNMRRVILDQAVAALAYSVTPAFTESMQMRVPAVMDFLKDYVLSTDVFPDETRMRFMNVDRTGGQTEGNRSGFDQTLWALTAPLERHEYDPWPLDYYDTMQGIGNGLISVRARNMAHATQEFNRIAMHNPSVRTGSHGHTYTVRADSPSPFARAGRGSNDNIGFFGGFGDGLPLIPPTRELVNEMLGGHERGRRVVQTGQDEILGWFKLNGGAISIERVAVNAVMAGARPEHFPIILAAAEMLATGWDYDKMWYHAMTTGSNTTMTIMISGPLGRELGISGDFTRAPAGNDVNNVIGRAIRLVYRNMGHITREMDDHATRGRADDFTMVLFRELCEYLPNWNPDHWTAEAWNPANVTAANPRPMWAPFHVDMGFHPDESVIFIWGGDQNAALGAGGANFWSPPTMAAGVGSGAWAGTGMNARAADAVMINPEMVRLLYEYHGIFSKDVLRFGRGPAANQVDTQSGFADFTGGPAFPGGGPATTGGFVWGPNESLSPPESRNVTVHPIVAGNALSPNRMFGSRDFYNRMSSQINLISGATLTTYGRTASIIPTHEGVTGDRVGVPTNPTPIVNPLATRRSTHAWLPSAPQNVNVTWSAGTIAGRATATLTWSPPACDGNADIIAYQVAFSHGGDTRFYTITNTSDMPSAFRPGNTVTGVDLGVAFDGSNEVHRGFGAAYLPPRFARNGETIGTASGGIHDFVPILNGQVELVDPTARGILTSGGDRIYTVSADARSFTFYNVPLGFEARFRVRAINNIRNAVEFDAVEGLTGQGNHSSGQMTGISPGTQQNGRRMFAYYTGDITVRSSGRGAWGLLMDAGGSEILPRVTESMILPFGGDLSVSSNGYDVERSNH